MHVVIVGAAGQLGSALTEQYSAAGHQVKPLSRRDLDITDREAVNAYFLNLKTDLVVNCAAFHNVGKCEEEIATAEEVNVYGVANLAVMCRRIGARFAHISTDYVFDGTKGSPYLESDTTRPLQVYGRTKLAGEYACLGSIKANLVIRTASLFGMNGRNSKGGDFPGRILAVAAQGAPLAIRNDLVMSPTYIPFLAQAIVQYTSYGLSGVVHLVGVESATWAELAEAFVRGAGFDTPIERLDTVAEPFKRPRYSVLATSVVDPVPSWREAVGRYVKAWKRSRA